MRNETEETGDKTQQSSDKYMKSRQPPHEFCQFTFHDKHGGGGGGRDDVISMCRQTGTMFDVNCGTAHDCGGADSMVHAISCVKIETDFNRLVVLDLGSIALAGWLTLERLVVARDFCHRYYVPFG